MSEGLKEKILSVLDARIDTVNKKYAFKMGMSTEEEELREIRKKMLVLLDEATNQIQEEAVKIGSPSNDYGEVCKQNRQYRSLVKKVLAVLDGEKK